MDGRLAVPLVYVLALVGVGSALGYFRANGAHREPKTLGRFPTRLDLGSLIEGQVIEVDVHLGRLSPRVMEKLRGQTSCGCTSFILPTVADEGASVKIRFDSTGKGANIRETVAFAWDEKGEQSTECELTGHVEKSGEVPVRTPLLPPGNHRVRLAIPFARVAGPWVVDCEGLAVRNRSFEKGRLMVEGDLEVPDRPNPDLRTLRITRPGVTVTMPLRIQTAATWTSEPTIITLGGSRDDEKAGRSVRITLKSPTRLSVDRVPQGIRVALTSKDSVHWDALVSAISPMKSLLNSEIVLRRSSGQKIVIPIVGVSASPDAPRSSGG